MVILAEPMPGVESAAFGFMMPAGTAMLNNGICGAANILENWLFRGAGDKNSRQLSDAIDSLGLQRHSGVGTYHLSLGAALEWENLGPALELYSDIICHPALSDEQFASSKQQALSEILSLEDNPRRKVMIELRKQFYPDPISRSTVGNLEQLQSLEAATTGRVVKNNFNLSNTIFSVAGKYDFDAVCSKIEKLFKTDGAQSKKEITLGKTGYLYTHIPNEGAQVHIGLMTKTISPNHPDYYNARMAVSILSGGMSARLFTEVREKRGLCYAVGAKYHSLKDTAGIACYAGTTSEKAQETADVIIDEFNRLKDGLSQQELDIAKVGLESSLILSSESSSSRSSSIAGDYFVLGRVRSLDEIKSEIEKTSVDSIIRFLKENPFEKFTCVTIGPASITPKG
jgi:predicted Zn-dependent peptidase